ncbi:MAG: cytochrome P450, partial [Gammaproteobacteria bacterium]
MSGPRLVAGHLALPPPAGVARWDVDPFDPAVLAAPDTFYAGLRERGPFVYLERYAMLACGRYAETRTVFSDHERFCSSRGVGLSDFAHDEPWRPPSLVLEVDPPYHTRTRSVLMRALSPRRVRELAADFRDAADALVANLLERRRIDGVADLAEAYPTRVFPAAIGLKDPDPSRLLDYAAMVFNALGPDNALRREAMARGATVIDWITAQCARENIRGDGLAASIYAAADDGEITREEAAMLVRSLLSAGLDTTVSALGNALWCLAGFPDEFARLRAEPALARAAFDEALRLSSPVHAFCRTAAVDTAVSGVDIAAGTKVLCVLAAANRDPA